MAHFYRLLSLFVMILVLRLGVAVLIDTTFEVSKDAEDVYARIGENLAQGNGFVAEPGGEPILHRAPLYPLFLAGIYALFGAPNPFAVLVSQALLDAASGLLIWQLGIRFGGRIGVIAALLFAIYPLSAYYTLRLQPESLFTLVLLTVIITLIRAMASGKSGLFLLVGILGAAAALVKPAMVGLIPFVAFLLLVRAGKQMAITIPQVCCLLGAFTLGLLPWTLRNYEATGHFIPVATGGGYSLWVGNNLISKGRDNDELEGTTLAALLQQQNALLAPFRKEDSRQDLSSAPRKERDRPVNISYEEDRAFTLAALHGIQAHPRETLGLWVRKFFRFWFSIYVLKNRWAQIYIYAAQSLLLLFAAYGVLRAQQTRCNIFPLVAVIVYVILVHTLIIATLRYSIPLVPVLLLFATLGVWDAVSRLAPRLGFPLPGIPQ